MAGWAAASGWCMGRSGSARRCSKTEGPVGVKKAGRVLKVHVVAGGSSLAVPALEEQDFLRDAGGYGCGEAALSGGDAGEAADVGAAGPEDAAQRITEHLVRDWDDGGNRATVRPVVEPGEQGRAVGAALRRVTLLGAEGRDP